ncbi:MAG: ABC transporter substrate-binding protein, partial [Pseudonocardia sp.]|nr:ABC transporter substrate-binding protein [Pseudonocardia sp.]
MLRPGGPQRSGTRVAGLLVVAALALTSCVASVTGGARREGYAVVALQEAPDALDPTLASSFVGRMIFANMCEKLYDVDANLNLVPQLASALPEISDDGRTYTIPLRPGVLFNDGTPMTADSVVRSIQRHKYNKLSQRTSELTAVSSIEATDPLTLRLGLSRPFAPLTSILADRSG